MYNMVFGENLDQKAVLLNVLGLSTGDFGRYRDIYVTEDHIVVYTRCGGGNRENYQHVFDEMREHPLYSYDEDDGYDCTYASIYFKHPENYHDLLVEMSKGTVTPSEKWDFLLTTLGK
jgi:hypothetical protein